MPSSDALKAFYWLVRADMLTFARSRVGMFWTFLFPLIALVSYVQLFAGPSLDGLKLSIRSDQTIVSRDFEAYLTRALQVQGVRSDPGAAQHQADGRIVIKAMQVGGQTKVVVATSPGQGDSEAYSLLAAVVKGVAERWNWKDHPAGQQVLVRSASISGSTHTRAQYVVPGLTVMIVLSSALMGFAVPLAAAREFGLTRQQSLWPIRAGTILLSWATGRFLIILASSMLIAGAGFLFYGFGRDSTVSGLLAAAAILILGAWSFLAVGLAIAARVKSTQTAMVITNIVYFAGILTGNIFIPTAGFAPNVREILSYSPLNCLSDALRRALSTAPDPAFSQTGWLPIFIVTVFGLACFVFAASTYRWSTR